MGVICRQLNATGDRQGKREMVEEGDRDRRGRKAAICASFNWPSIYWGFAYAAHSVTRFLSPQGLYPGDAHGSVVAFVFQGCCNKLAPTGKLKTFRIYSLSPGGQEAEIKVLAVSSSLRELQGRICSCLFQLWGLSAFPGSGPRVCSVCTLPPPLPVCYLLLSLLMTSVITPHPTPQSKVIATQISPLHYTCKGSFSKSSHIHKFQGSGFDIFG